MANTDLLSAGAEPISKAAETLISKSFSALSWLNDPKGIKHAISDAHRSFTQEIINNENISPTDKMIFLNEYNRIMKSNKNIRQTIKDAFSFLDESSHPEELDEDWLVDFFDKVSKISNDDIRIIWSKILAEEANCPSKFSRKLLHSLFIMSSNDRDAFANLSGFVFLDRGRGATIAHPIIFIRDHPRYYADNRITTDVLASLQYLGLVECNYSDPFIFTNKKLLLYSSHHIDLYGDKINAGNVLLTSDGQALFAVIEKANSTTKLDSTIMFWKEYGVRVQSAGFSQHHETILSD